MKQFTWRKKSRHKNRPLPPHRLLLCFMCVSGLLVVLLSGLAACQASERIIYHERFGPHRSADPTLRGDYEPIATDFQFITSLTSGPDGRLFASEFRTGRIVAMVPTDDGDFRVEAFSEVPLPPDLPPSEQGLWHLAVHPNEPYLYASAVAEMDPQDHDQRGTFRVVRFELLADGTAGPLEEVLTGLPAAAAHNGGALAFGPDEKLYVTLGDTHVPERAVPSYVSDLSELVGVILRFNPDGSIPADGVISPDSPVYAYGFRNPYGIVVTPYGTMYVTENGPACCDQLIRVEPGANHGWPKYGREVEEMDMMKEDPLVVAPFLHTDKWVPGLTQITYYQGNRYGGALRGDLLYGAFHTGSLHRVVIKGDRRGYEEILVMLPTSLQFEEVFGDAGGVVGVTVGADGYVYFASLDTVYRLTNIDVNEVEAPVRVGIAEPPLPLPFPLNLLPVTTITGIVTAIVLFLLVGFLYGYFHRAQWAWASVIVVGSALMGVFSMSWGPRLLFVVIGALILVLLSSFGGALVHQKRFGSRDRQSAQDSPHEETGCT